MIRKLLWVMVAATSCVSVAACGDDDDSDDASSTDWDSVSTGLTEDLSADTASIQEVDADVDEDGKTLELEFDVSESPDDPAQFAFWAVQDMQSNYPDALDGIDNVRVHIDGPAGETEETYPYNEVRSWIETGAIGTGAVQPLTAHHH